MLGLYFPFLSTDRLRNGRKAGDIPARRNAITTSAPAACKTGSDHSPVSYETRWDKTPVATIVPKGGVLRIIQINQTAHGFGIHPGQTLADAKSMAPQLITYNDNPKNDRRQLEALAIWADRFSPIVHIEGDDTLILDITGCKQLFGGEENLLHRAMEGVDDQGFAVRGAIADTPGAAWALCHAHRESFVISEPGQVVGDLAMLPVRSLRIDASTVEALHRVGVHEIASLLHLPRSSLTSRFGQALIDRIDQALGDLTEVLVPYRAPQVLKSSIHFGQPTDRLDILTESFRRTLEPFCEKLAKQVVGVQQMFATFYLSPGPTDSGRPDENALSGKQRHAKEHARKRSVTLPVNLAQPTRSVKHLFSLLLVALENQPLPAPAESLILWARELQPLDDWQEQLFTTDLHDERALGDLVDRLSVRLNSASVVSSKPANDHQPERAFQYVPLTDQGVHKRAHETVNRPHGTINATRAIKERAMGASRMDAPVMAARPLRLFSRPIEVSATAVVPEGPPISFRFQGHLYAVALSVGPERIETGWWRGPHLKRDYYRVTTQEGSRAWLFRERDTNHWFLHGWFD